jgi:hypothetical protein
MKNINYIIELKRQLTCIIRISILKITWIRFDYILVSYFFSTRCKQIDSNFVKIKLPTRLLHAPKFYKENKIKSDFTKILLNKQISN